MVDPTIMQVITQPIAVFKNTLQFIPEQFFAFSNNPTPTVAPTWQCVVDNGIFNLLPVIITIEEHTIVGGLGSAVAEAILEADFDQPKKFKRIGIPDVFADQYGSQDSLMARYGITSDELIKVTRELVTGTISSTTSNSR